MTSEEDDSPPETQRSQGRNPAEVERVNLLQSERRARNEANRLARRLVEIQELERGEIARELHDEVGQLLTGLNLMIESARIEGDDLREDMRRVVQDLIRRVRNLSMDLRPPMLDEMGLLEALVWQIGRFEARTGIRVRLTHSELTRRFPPPVEITAFRVVQEALTNVARHSGAPAADVDVRVRGNGLSIRVEDNGRGFRRDVLRGHSMGVAGMSERCRLIGGRLRIVSNPGSGTRVRARLPILPALEASEPHE